jgi:hypothetical protein
MSAQPAKHSNFLGCGAVTGDWLSQTRSEWHGVAGWPPSGVESLAWLIRPGRGQASGFAYCQEGGRVAETISSCGCAVPALRCSRVVNNYIIRRSNLLLL